jgi:undecaprenyl-diphosphatase
MAMVFREGFESLFGSVISVGICWLVTGAFLLFSRKFQHGDRTILELNHQDSFVIGLVQGLAIMPGISRSGATVMTGMALGLEKENAARYSFFLAIPAILGAGLLEFKSAVAIMTQHPAAVCAGFCTAAVSGYIAIFFLLRLIRSGKFFLFGFYCITLSLIVLIYSLVHFTAS